ncbi:MAG: DUF2334 domain-containing protein, partial [Chthoniobacteraceae bacterium]|nr:DUF2334 domain-containing protein [Chthoniobacteraceae bacterium]
ETPAEPPVASIAPPETAAAPSEAPVEAPVPPPAESQPAKSQPAGTPPAMCSNRDLVVSIHDVSPLTREATSAMLAELRELGVSRVTLLVVPDHHRKGHLLDHPEFCAWLRERVTLGDEVAIHGYYHRRDQRAGETLREKLTTRYYTAGEGEFYDIAGADALRIISQARQEFRKAGLEPEGFVAPAWLLSEGADRALQRLGLTYTTRIGGIFDYATGVRHASQSLVWSSRSWWRRILSRMWNAYLFRRLRRRNLLRIGIHPPDRQHRAIWGQIKTLISKALKDRNAATYAGYLKKR